jgi:hypothetical protein
MFSLTGGYKMPDGIVNKYVLKTDDRMPSRNNYWGIEVAGSPEEAEDRFRKRIEGSYIPAKNGYLQRREEDRERRLREDDVRVELL